ncbi:peptidoglycan/LPS O-acetylase OafA/YrhL [Mariniflexile fucanivorans]|uniref:Peptidoglycan/LPS O-acetylase OafA/YrhL n=1 Tax=Mariniflexile fucanivorans TaxID=264023 RepID=A0A4R1RCL0_9FLAO|nr:acyltransferase [Mariniflexile fucanivorans]TCL63553.1 peptidoglycan/LPS O-acetylase OafA/YrhL [Mariniflexile fucanivorans]
MNKINTNNFDFLRVVFATTVAIAHMIGLAEIELFQPYQIYFNTRLAIDGFFVISGFLIAKSYENTNSIKEYLFRRIKRIVPAYFFVIILSAIFFSLISTYSINQYFFSGEFWKYLLANLTFQNYLQPCLPGVFTTNLICAVNGALWTIKIEEAFYLLVPVFYWLVKSKRVNIYFLSAIVYLISVAYFNYFVSIDNYRIAKQLPGALAFFVVGIMFYRNFSFLLKYKHYIILPCLILFLVEQYVFETQYLKPIAYGFMVFYFAYSFKWLNNFGKYGDFTYGIYIYHFPIIQLVVYYGFFNIYNPVLTSVFVLLVTLVFAVLSWHFLELRFLSKNRKMRQKELISVN